MIASTSTPNSSRKTVPLSLPKLGEYAELPLDVWTEFWTTKVHPIAARIEKTSFIHNLIGWLSHVPYTVAFVYALIAFFWNLRDFEDVGPFLSAIAWSGRLLVANWIVRLVGRTWIFLARMGQLHSLKNICREQGLEIFQKHGYAVEWSCDVNDESYSYDFSLDFYPIHVDDAKTEGKVLANGATHRQDGLHIELCKLLFDGSGDHLFSPASIVDLHILYTNFHPITFGTDDQLTPLWHTFWSHLQSTYMKVLSQHHWNRTMFFISTLVFLAICFADGLGKVTPLKYYAFCLYVILYDFISRRYSVMLKPQSHLVEKYSPEFAKHGLLLEFRRKVNFGWINSYSDQLHVTPSAGNIKYPTDDGAHDRADATTQ